MQVKEVKNEGLSRQLEVTVPAADIDRHVERRLKEVGKTLRLPGFRPGKVPLDILKKRYGRAVMGEVLEAAVNESTGQALKDKGLRPAVQPKIEVKSFDEGKDLTFALDVEVLPEFKVMDLKGLPLEKPVAKVEAKSVDEALQRIGESNRATKKVEENRASKKGDILVMDYHGRTKDDNVAHEGMHAHGAKLELGSGRFIAGFEDQLTGKKAGDKVEVNVSFPKDYAAKDLAGRDAVFDVDIHEIHEAAPVEAGELAKNLGFEDEASLRKAVEQQIQKDYDGLSRLKLKRQLLDALDEKHDFDIPQAMVDMEYDAILRQIEQERKTNPAEGGEVTDEEKEELKAISERRVRLGLILSEVGKQNNISITDQEVQRAVIGEAQKYPGHEKQVFEFYQKNRNALESLRAPLFEDKVVDHIFSIATMTEKTVSLDELTAEDDDAEKPKKKASSGKKAPAKKSEKK